MPNQERKERALESFAAWFAGQECAWKDVRKDPPTDTMLVLLKDSKANVVRLGYRTTGGGWQIQDAPKGFAPHQWMRIP